MYYTNQLTYRQKENLIIGLCFLITPLYSLPFVIVGMMHNSKFAFFLWSVFMGMIGMVYAPTGDIYRYTELAHFLRGLKINEVTSYCIFTNEYILSYLYFILNKFNIDSSVGSFIYQFVAYLLLTNIYFDILKNNTKWDKYRLLLFIIIFPITLSMFLFRFYFSMILFIYGTYVIVFNKKKFGWLFIILSILNHFSYIIFAIGFIFYKSKYLQFNKVILVYICLFALILDSVILIDIFKLIPDTIVNRYIGYLDGYYASAYLNDHSLKYKIWIYASNFMAYIGIYVYITLYSKKYRKQASYVNIILIITSLTSTFSTIFNRFLTILFIAIRIFLGYTFNGIKSLKLIKIIAIAVILSNILNLWSKRREFVLSDYQIFLYQTTPQILMHRYSQEWINNHIFPDGDYII